MSKTLDCVVCGSCVVDMLVRPVSLDRAIGGGRLIHVEPIGLTTGGIVSNSGIALALGMRTAAFSYVGRDEWAPIIRRKYEAEGLDASHLLTHPTGATSTTAVLIDPSGERTFAHCVGAPREMNGRTFLDHMALFRTSRMALLGYYSLMPNLEPDLPAVLEGLRQAGCQTALDAAGDGGTMEPLDKLLPHLDVYVPSHNEAEHQTGEKDPKKIIDVYRRCGAPGVLGVKLGARGALLSDKAGRYIEVEPVAPPGQVVDTTGAGDSFYAGLITGLLRGMSLADAGRLGAATGACCVTALGATAGLRDYNETARLAGIVEMSNVA
jgi:sugar/nucleoside kinase (ribokinase family)